MSSLSPMLVNLSMKDGKPVKITELDSPKGRKLEDFEPLDEQYMTGKGSSSNTLTASDSLMFRKWR